MRRGSHKERSNGVLQEAGTYNGKHKTKYLSGGIKNIKHLLSPENIRKLENLNVGVISFLAFYPKIDTAILEYVEKGSLASDSGRDNGSIHRKFRSENS